MPASNIEMDLDVKKVSVISAINGNGPSIDGAHQLHFKTPNTGVTVKIH